MYLYLSLRDPSGLFVQLKSGHGVGCGAVLPVCIVLCHMHVHGQMTRHMWQVCDDELSVSKLWPLLPSCIAGQCVHHGTTLRLAFIEQTNSKTSMKKKNYFIDSFCDIV